MEFEYEFSHALRQIAEREVPPHVGDMAAGAQLRGTRRKRRRTIATTVATVAVMAGVGVGALTFQVRPAATEASSAPATVLAAASSAAPKITTPATSTEMLGLFRERLPAGLSLSDPLGIGSDTPPQKVPANLPPLPPRAAAEYVITDARGQGSVQITIVRWKDGETKSKDICQSTPTCTSSEQPGGGTLRVNRPTRSAFGLVWDVTYSKAGGALVTVTSSNLPGPGTHADGPTRDAPVLDTPQLQAIALDPVWQEVGKALQ